MADKRDYKGELVQCAKCGRVIGADQVNTTGRCEICSPPPEKPSAAAAREANRDK
jgi:predicted Zn-ribbon and HTH transcriptional regulator